MAETFALQIHTDLPIRLSIAAQLTGIPESSLRDKIMRGEIHAKKDGSKLYLVRLKDLAAWFETLNDAQSYCPKEETPATAQRGRQPRSSAKRKDPIQGDVERSARLRLRAEDL